MSNIATFHLAKQKNMCSVIRLL